MIQIRVGGVNFIYIAFLFFFSGRYIYGNLFNKAWKIKMGTE